MRNDDRRTAAGRQRHPRHPGALLAEVETTLAPWQSPSGLAFQIGALLISALV